eukprot:scaffold2269_cov65-Cylindrotheca_fusiformis.AAC.2
MTPSLHLIHFESKFLQSLRDYLVDIDAQIEVDEPFVPPPQRENDCYLMDVALTTTCFDAEAVKRINYCRLFLQAVTLSDITFPDRLGNMIDPSLVTGAPNSKCPKSTYCPTKQAKPTASSWKIWQQFCDILEEQLQRAPLGRWTQPGSSLRSSWQSYFDHASQLLYYRDESTDHQFFQLHHIDGTDDETYSSDEPSQGWSITSSCVPVLTQEIAVQVADTRCLTVEIIGGVASYCPIPPPEYAPRFEPAPNFDEYIKELPHYEQLLFASLDICIPTSELLDILNETSVDLEGPDNLCVGVSDGSEYQGSMTFGWTFASPDGFRMVTCAGPAFGAQASSYRAEGYGFVSMALFLYHFRRFTAATPDWQFRFVSDNLGLVTKVQQAKSFDFPFPNLTLDPDYDLVHETIMTLRKTRVQTRFSHVKGHQDSLKTPFDELPLVTQLNIEADDLAGRFRTETNNLKYPTVPMLHHTRCLLHLANAETATRSYKQTIRNIVPTSDLHQYMLKTFRWTASTIRIVDWTVFQRCRARLNHRHIQMTKLIFDLLPTAVVVARSQPAAKDVCPLCKVDPETNAHLYQCSAASVRSWRSTTLTELRTLLEQWDTKHGLVEVLMSGLSLAFDAESGDQLSLMEFPLSLHSLIQEQNSIGWQQLLRGRVSCQWAKLQQEVYTARSETDKTVTGTTWITTVVTSVLTQVLDLWKQRNDFVYGKTPASQNIRKEKVINELRFIHDHRADYRPCDLQFLLTDDPDFEEEKFRSVIATDGVRQTEVWVKDWKDFFHQSIKKARSMPTAVRRTPSIRSVFQPLRQRIVNLRRRPPDSQTRPRASRRRTPTPRTSNNIASFFTSARHTPPPA